MHKSYGGTPVLRGLDLDVPAGQRLAIIGRSGSGKSTLLRLLMTLDRPDSGDIIINSDHLWHERRDDRLVPARKAHVDRVRANVGMVFQHFNLFPNMTALGNITIAPRKVLGISTVDADQQAHRLLEMVGLEGKANAYPGELSGGQKQRVAIARALAMEPKIMLFDEVTSALDPELVGEVQTVLKELARRSGMTMLIVTHEMRFARDIADRVLFINDGVVVEDGPPHVVLERPANEETQLFLQSLLCKE
ncbi:MAG: amino acid ABC transporter ATP-binding protein [Planctomycetes bacterium]|nr:amino acid ABC transporter ATP-binding protein [Planctomycetota bacterium]